MWSFEGLSRGHCGWKVEEAKAVMVDKQFSVDTFLLNALLLIHLLPYIPSTFCYRDKQAKRFLINQILRELTS